MKKILSIILTLTLILPMAGCKKNEVESEPEKALETTEKDTTPTIAIRPLEMRGELIDELTDEFSDLHTKYEVLPDDDSQKETLRQQMDDVYEALTEVKKGINGEEDFIKLSETIQIAADAAKILNTSGEPEKASAVLDLISIVMYGNFEGEKTW